MGRIVEMSGIRMHRVDHGGEGTAIVLVHGLGGSTADWEAVAPALSQLGRVVAVDLPRFGFSPPAAEDGLEPMTHTLAEFLEQIGGETGGPVVLIGNSMGALLSTLVAARRPDLVKALVLVAPAFPPRWRDLPGVHWPTFLRLAVQAAPLTGEALDAWLHRLRPRDRVQLTLAWVAHKPGRVPLPVVEDLIEVSTRRRDLPWSRGAVTAASRSIANLWARRGRIVDAVRAIEAPTLVIQGTGDRLISPAAVESFSRLRPDWDVAQLNDTGHVPHLDAPFRFADVVVPWLRRHMA